MQDWRNTNPERSKSYQNSYRAKHLNKVRNWDRERSKRDAQRRAVWQHQYRQQHPDRVRAARKSLKTTRGHYVKYAGIARRRAVKIALPAQFTGADWKRALDYFDHRCAACGRTRGL